MTRKEQWEQVEIVYGKNDTHSTLKEFFSSRPVRKYIPVSKYFGYLIAFDPKVIDSSTFFPKNLEVACVSKLFWKNCKKILKWADKNS